MNQLQNPHDKLFKEFFTQLDVTQDFLSNYLPETLLQRLDLDHLHLEQGSFIDPELDEQFSDLLFSLPRTDQKGEAYVYFLLEHKSYQDAWVALQLLSYMVRIWERQRQEGAKQLSPVIPLLIYHGTAVWRGRVAFADLYDTPDPFQAYLPQFEYLLYDFSHRSEQEIRGAAALQLVLRIMRHIFDGTIAQQLPELIALLGQLKKQQNPLQYLTTIIRYLLSSGDKISPEQIRAAVDSQLTHFGDETMSTFAQQILDAGRQEGLLLGRKEGRQEGRREGRHEGRKEGRQEGLQLGKQEAILRLLERRFSVVEEGVRGRVNAITNLNTLDQLLYQAAIAETVAQFAQSLDGLAAEK